MSKVFALFFLCIAFVLPMVHAQAATKPGQSFSDCSSCPTMVVIGPGQFVMGSPASEPGHNDAEEPVHRVTISRAFAIARFDVTRAQYAIFAGETHRPSDPKCDWQNPKAHGVPFAQTPDDPVVCVSSEDAEAYAAWLSRKTGRRYRLPSEAEWEYAARAGSQAARPWGDGISHENANYGADACCGPAVGGRDTWMYTSPAGSFPPNAFGIYDAIGNVWQWTQDCAQSYALTPVDGSAATTGDCTRHMVRGGGWFHGPDAARSAGRAGDLADLRVADIGFRVAAEP